ncbi:hypothetical protein [Rhodococcoides yunnanense]|uniref:hypothetical protein n=1 Tax=Rhodococcoides yunnanense TaxID=278209 RepID=UPI00093217F9|nr:hypothetical protein [Rhodococcus yunnanensis]
MIPERSAGPAHRAQTYSERTAIAAESARDLRYRVSQIALAPRNWTLTGRALLILVTTAVAFAPALSANLFAVIDGSPTLYLVLLPTWAINIGYGIDQNTRGRVINDKELDWIAALTIGVVVTGCIYLAMPRLLASATLWHIELLPILAWVFCGCILNFGVRRSFRGWRILVFTVFCFPGTVLIIGAKLGGTPLAFSLVVAVLNSVAVWLALAHRSGRWWLTLATAMVTVLGALLLTPLSSIAGLLLPSAATSIGVAVYEFRRTGVRRSAYLAMPQRSLISVLVLGVIAVTVLALLPGPAARVRADSMVTAPADWLDRLADSNGISVDEHTRFDWGPAFMGPGGSVVRYELDVAQAPDEVLFLDVFTAESAGVLANFRGAIWYATNPPARVSDQFFRIGGVVASGSQNGAEDVRSPEEPLWAALGWTWKTHSDEEGTRYQRIYLMKSKRAQQPYNVPLPQEPTFAGTILGPISWLARSPDTGESEDSNEYLDGLAVTVETILSGGDIDG